MVWGGESSSISPLLRNSGAPSTLNQIVHKSSYLYSLFHSVIYNSVVVWIPVRRWIYWAQVSSNCSMTEVSASDNTKEPTRKMINHLRFTSWSIKYDKFLDKLHKDLNWMLIIRQFKEQFCWKCWKLWILTSLTFLVLRSSAEWDYFIPKIWHATASSLQQNHF